MENRYGLKFTPIAISDIDEAMIYISGNLANPAAANRLFEELEEAIDKIRCFPYAFADCSYYMVSDKNIRHIRVNNYILIYEIVEERKMIHVLRFRYSKTDFTQINIK